MFYLKILPISLKKIFFVQHPSIKITYKYNIQNFEFLTFYLLFYTILYSYIYKFQKIPFKLILNIGRHEFFFLLNFFWSGFYWTLFNKWSNLTKLLTKIYAPSKSINLIISIYTND